VTALDQGAKYLMTEPQMKYILVAGGYGMSRFLDFTDKKTANLFADGAGAVVLGVGEEQGFLGSEFAGGRFLPRCAGDLHRRHVPSLHAGKYGAVWRSQSGVRQEIPQNLQHRILAQTDARRARQSGLTFDDVDHYYFTQLNLRTIEFMMDLLKQPIEKAHWVMDKWGYTGSPCVVMALDDRLSRAKVPSPVM
jgi:3-oxoacyl-[acyl-carrier-protein] synthase III